jgi:hypothetical protein
MINEIQQTTTLAAPALITRIESAMVDTQLDWHYNKHTEPMPPDAFDHPEHYRKHEFYHNIYCDRTIVSDLYHVVEPLLLFFNRDYGMHVLDLHSITAHYRFPQPNYNELSFDTPQCLAQDIQGGEWMQITYFTHDADGELIVFNNRCDERPMPYKLKEAQQFKPQRGLCVMHDARRYHSHRSPMNTRDRWHIDFLFRVA